MYLYLCFGSGGDVTKCPSGFLLDVILLMPQQLVEVLQSATGDHCLGLLIVTYPSRNY